MEASKKNKTWELIDLLVGKKPKGCGVFAKVMKNMGYRQSKGDHILFIKHSDSSGVTTLLVYVDDIIIMRNDENERDLKEMLEIFEIKELGRLKYFLEIEVTPIDPNHKLREVEEDVTDREINIDYVGSMVDRRSTTEYYIFLGGNLVTWISKNRVWWRGPVQK
uniref:Reverse transcriptase Ty1/copia-type domain-containing protein n=1 Tax=Vitis vinifera TaxID=29760 RepID=A5C029_VITVI|nr:hypothetical protein VITISV_008471 [Vitis vinifera]